MTVKKMSVRFYRDWCIINTDYRVSLCLHFLLHVWVVICENLAHKKVDKHNRLIVRPAILIFFVTPLRFTHFLPANNLYPPARADVTKTLSLVTFRQFPLSNKRVYQFLNQIYSLNLKKIYIYSSLLYFG